MPSGRAEDPETSLWTELGTVEQAKSWEKFRPGTFEELLAETKRRADLKRQDALKVVAHAREDAAHARRLDYISVTLQFTALFCGIAAVAVMALTAKYYVDHKAASQGARIFGFGSGSIVAAFVGVKAIPIVQRVSSEKKRNKDK